MTDKARILGSILLVVGYFVMLNYDTRTGVIIRIFANLLSLPWSIRNRVWDFTALLGFFLAIELHSLTHGGR
jgi:hypothetical protein